MNLKFAKKKRLNHSKEEDRLWKWFSRYIRVRDTSRENGLCRCITCPTYLPPGEMQAGHYIKRNRFNIKYHEMNVNAQCPRCNCFDDGAQAAYVFALDQKYGPGTAKMLLDISSRNGRLDTWECNINANDYRDKTNELLKKHGIEKWWK